MAMASVTPNANEKFKPYINPAIKSEWVARSLKPSASQFAVIIALCACCAVTFILAMVQEARVMELIASLSILRFFAYELVKVVQILSGLIFGAATMALCKAILLKKWAESVLCTTKNSPGPKRSSAYKPALVQVHHHFKPALVPVHHHCMEYMQWPPEFVKVCSLSQTKQESDEKVPSPRSNYGSGTTKDNIYPKEQLEQFLPDVEEKLTEAAENKMKAAAAAAAQGSATGTSTSPSIQGLGAFTNTPPCMSSTTIVARNRKRRIVMATATATPPPKRQKIMFTNTPPSMSSRTIVAGNRKRRNVTATATQPKRQKIRLPKRKRYEL